MPPIRSNRRRLPIASAVAGFVAATTTADTITVCASGCAFTSINAAIDAAKNGSPGFGQLVMNALSGEQFTYHEAGKALKALAVFVRAHGPCAAAHRSARGRRMPGG